MDRRDFLKGTAAIGTAVIVPRQFPRTISERDKFDSGEMNTGAVIRLYHYDKLVVETPTFVDSEQVGGTVIYGRGAEVRVTASQDFTFNRATVEVGGIPKEADLPLSQTYTVTKGSMLTLQADARGLLSVRG